MKRLCASCQPTSSRSSEGSRKCRRQSRQYLIEAQSELRRKLPNLSASVAHHRTPVFWATVQRDEKQRRPALLQATVGTLAEVCESMPPAVRLEPTEERTRRGYGPS